MNDAGDRPEPLEGEALSAEEAGRRAAGGTGLLLARGALILVLGVGANVALARLLTPRDFGLVALGSVLLVFGNFLADGGLGVGLIRRHEAVSGAEIAAVSAVQLALTGGIVAAAVGVAALVGRDGWVVALMVASLPITMLKVPSIIVLERRIDYRLVATVDLVEAVAFYTCALVAVALGAGVWGFAGAAVARALAGAAVMLWRGPLGVVRPRWSWPLMRPLLGFGAKFQGAVVVNLVRDQTLNVLVAAIAGVAALGVWNLAWRVLQVPFMVFGTLGRVGFPAMSRLLQAGEDPRPVLERGGAALTVLSAAMMVAVVGLAPALPAILGSEWHDAPAVLFWSGAILVAAFPVVVTGPPYLLAAGAAGTVLKAAVGGAVVWLTVAVILLPGLGVPAAAIGWCAGGVVQIGVLARGTSARSGAALFRSVGLPSAIGIAALVAAWLVADAAGRGLGASLLAVTAGEVLLFAMMVTLRSAALSDARGFLKRAIGGAAGAARPAGGQV